MDDFFKKSSIINRSRSLSSNNDSERTYSSQITPYSLRPHERLFENLPPANVSQEDYVENITTEDGANIKVTRSLKDMTGNVPDSHGRQFKETREQSGKGIKAVTDLQAEAYQTPDGTQIKRSSVSSRIKYSSGDRGAISSLLTAPKLDQATTSKLLTSDYDTTLRLFKTDSSSSSSSVNIRSSSASAIENRDRYPMFTPFPKPKISQAITKTKAYSTMQYAKILTQDEIKALASSVSYLNSQNIDVSQKDDSKNAKGLLTRANPPIKEIVPPTFCYEIENVTVKKDGTAYFKGTVNGSYPFYTIWRLDDHEIRPDGHFETSLVEDHSETYLTGLIDYIISLKINNCSHRDIGKYTAFVKNEAGNASCSAFLIIEGKNY